MLNKLMRLLLFGLLYLEKIQTVEVNTTSGVVRGHAVDVLKKTVQEFLGIPYSESPIGELRFAKPKPITSPIRVSSLKQDNLTNSYSKFLKLFYSNLFLI